MDRPAQYTEMQIFTHLWKIGRYRGAQSARNKKSENAKDVTEV